MAAALPAPQRAPSTGRSAALRPPQFTATARRRRASGQRPPQTRRVGRPSAGTAAAPSGAHMSRRTTERGRRHRRSQSTPADSAGDVPTAASSCAPTPTASRCRRIPTLTTPPPVSDRRGRRPHLRPLPRARLGVRSVIGERLERCADRRDAARWHAQAAVRLRLRFSEAQDYAPKAGGLARIPVKRIPRIRSPPMRNTGWARPITSAATSSRRPSSSWPVTRIIPKATRAPTTC